MIIAPFVFKFRDELSVMLRLADVMYALRTVAYKETEDLPSPLPRIAWGDRAKRFCARGETIVGLF